MEWHSLRARLQVDNVPACVLAEAPAPESQCAPQGHTHATPCTPHQGRPLDSNKEALITNVRSSECMKMAWHPLLPLLAIGWKDGAR